VHPSPIDILATVAFALAIFHTFSVKRLQHWAHGLRPGSVAENVLHLLGEVEVVFGLWAGVFLMGLLVLEGPHAPLAYIEGHYVPAGADQPAHVNFTEPAFVFVVLVVAATRPVLALARGLISLLAGLLPLHPAIAFYAVTLVLGPLLGSFITEPAAMTVAALLLKERFCGDDTPSRLKYATLGLLFVNVSIGGTLTHFAAPPVLMVAGPDRFDWDTAFMLTHFGWKAALAVIVNTAVVTWLFRNAIRGVGPKAPDGPEAAERMAVPAGLVLTHLGFLVLIVVLSHHPLAFLGVFLFFIGMVVATEEYQEPLQLRQGLLVGFFLGGLVLLGAMQDWWLQPVLSQLGELPLYLGAAGLTAFTDNAALTYLGAQVEGLTDGMKYALVAGAVAGGGLTVIANAPNPAGFGILRECFGEEGISPTGLLVAALGPTAVALACFWFLPSF